MSKPIILITNDDGILAPGIRALVDVASQYGTPVVVAPNTPQSGQGHAITIVKPLFLNKVDVFDGIEAYECSGTPADCVKLAKSVILKDREIALCVSGINHGSNASINIIYSGTMSAAMEASLENIPSIGFSLLDYSFDANFEPAKPFIGKIIADILKRKVDNTLLLNVNIPNTESIKGIKICRQGEGTWTEDFQESTDPRGQKYYWLKGEFSSSDRGEDSDLGALDRGYISVVPSQHNLTDHKSISSLKHLEK